MINDCFCRPVGPYPTFPPWPLDLYTSAPWRKREPLFVKFHRSSHDTSPDRHFTDTYIGEVVVLACSFFWIWDFGGPKHVIFDFVFLLLCLCAFVCLLCPLWCSVFWFACHWFLRLTLSCTDHRPVRDNNNVEFSAPWQIGNKCVENKMIYSWSEIYSNHICPGLTLDQWETVIILKNTTLSQARAHRKHKQNTGSTNKPPKATQTQKSKNLSRPSGKHNPEKRTI